MIQKEKTYLRWKYRYYNGDTEVSDSEFDTLENELKELGSVLVYIVGSPNYDILEKYDLIDELSVGEREIRFHHQYQMGSLKKHQVKLSDDLNEVFPAELNNYFSKVPNETTTCTPKFDGNSMELTYSYGLLIQGLTRGNELGGLDRTDKMKLIVPNELPSEYKEFERVVIRGEVIIATKLWERKYSNPDKVDNPRNWVAGVMNKEETNGLVMKDIDFMAYQIVKMVEGDMIRPEKPLEKLKEIGFEEVFSLTTTGFGDFFTNIFPKFKKYRETSKHLLDGIVLNLPTKYWDRLGENSHHPHYACAVKFVPTMVVTTVLDIIWTLGKDGEYTPIAQLEPVELDGTTVRQASMHNLGWIIDNKVYPGCSVEIAKKGEIIPQIINVIAKSIDNDKYEEYISNFIKNHQ